MLNRIVILAIFTSIAFGDTIDCSAIFEQKKGEIIDELRKVREQKQLVNVFYDEQKRLNDEKLEELKIQEQKVQALIVEAKERESAIKELIKHNEDLLAQLDNKKNEKIAQTYSKMKDSKAGAIIENMPLNEAAELLFSMDSKDIGKILAKMDTQKAARLTQMIKKGPPFEEE